MKSWVRFHIPSFYLNLMILLFNWRGQFVFLLIHYDVYISCYLEEKIFLLRNELIRKERIKIFIHFDDEKLLEKYEEKLDTFKEQPFIFTEDPSDEEIGIAFLNLFSHNRFAADFIMRNIPIIDISCIGKF